MRSASCLSGWRRQGKISALCTSVTDKRPDARGILLVCHVRSLQLPDCSLCAGYVNFCVALQVYPNKTVLVVSTENISQASALAWMLNVLACPDPFCSNLWVPSAVHRGSGIFLHAVFVNMSLIEYCFLQNPSHSVKLASLTG